MTAEHDLTGKNSPRRVESYRSGLDRPGFDVAFPVEMQALARLDRERELGQEWTP